MELSSCGRHLQLFTCLLALREACLEKESRSTPTLTHVFLEEQWHLQLYMSLFWFLDQGKLP